MQFVQSVPVAEVLATEGNIQVGRKFYIHIHVHSVLLSSADKLYNFSFWSCLDRASSGNMHQVKKGRMASAQRWWTRTSRAVVSHFKRFHAYSLPAEDPRGVILLLLCPSSWLLCHHIHPGSRRQTPGQPAADKDRWGKHAPPPLPQYFISFIHFTKNDLEYGHIVCKFLLSSHVGVISSLHPGKLFHIDFGYILGRDPKPLPPPMKLSKEMVEGMGGMQSEQYQEFRKQCYTAFLHLRR